MSKLLVQTKLFWVSDVLIVFDNTKVAMWETLLYHFSLPQVSKVVQFQKCHLRYDFLMFERGRMFLAWSFTAHTKFSCHPLTLSCFIVEKKGMPRKPRRNYATVDLLTKGRWWECLYSEKCELKCVIYKITYKCC